MVPWMDDELNERRRQNLYRSRRRLQSGQGARIRLAGRLYRNFSSNDYLDLATDPRLARAAARAGRRFGTGAGASPLVSGYLPPLRALERDLAHWEGTESALVFSSGYAANLAVLTALAGPDDTIFSDAFNHASLIDGCRLSRARVQVYRHNDLEHLEQLVRYEPPGLSRRSGPARRLIVSDSVFSMDGDLTPLAELLALAQRYDCLVVLDEAHATGVVGEQGRGVTDLLPDLAPGRDRLIKVGTLSKALGAQGGFVCGSRRLIEFLVNHARPYIFSTALSPPLAAAARRAIAIVQQEPQRRHRVLALAQMLRQRLARVEPAGGPSTLATPIIPVIVGDCHSAVALSRQLQEEGLLVPAIRPPSVPEGTARLRISLTAGHTEEDIEALLAALGSRQAHPLRCVGNDPDGS